MTGPAWRVGRKVGRTLYYRDELVGVMDSRSFAEQVVSALNSRSIGPAQVTELHAARVVIATARRLVDALQVSGDWADSTQRRAVVDALDALDAEAARALRGGP